MKRRSFLKLLGLAPAAALPLPTIKAANRIRPKQGTFQGCKVETHILRVSNDAPEWFKKMPDKTWVRIAGGPAPKEKP